MFKFYLGNVYGTFCSRWPLKLTGAHCQLSHSYNIMWCTVGGIYIWYCNTIMEFYPLNILFYNIYLILVSFLNFDQSNFHEKCVSILSRKTVIHQIQVENLHCNLFKGIIFHVCTHVITVFTFTPYLHNISQEVYKYPTCNDFMIPFSITLHIRWNQCNLRIKISINIDQSYCIQWVNIDFMPHQLAPE